jgi:1,4-dihydroxy-2-naphthoyl-CoA hydrolase
MSIWFKKYSIGDVQFLQKGNMLEHIGIELTEIGEDFVKARMPVDHRTVQPMNILHGGASVALAESLGSIASYLVVDHNQFDCVGLDINANHIRPVSSGFVFAIARPFHIGRRTHVWSIDITDEKGKRICVSRLTMAVIDKVRNEK